MLNSSKNYNSFMDRIKCKELIVINIEKFETIRFDRKTVLYFIVYTNQNHLKTKRIDRL